MGWLAGLPDTLQAAVATSKLSNSSCGCCICCDGEIQRRSLSPAAVDRLGVHPLYWMFQSCSLASQEQKWMSWNSASMNLTGTEYTVRIRLFCMRCHRRARLVHCQWRACSGRAANSNRVKTLACHVTGGGQELAAMEGAASACAWVGMAKLALLPALSAHSPQPSHWRRRNSRCVHLFQCCTHATCTWHCPEHCQGTLASCHDRAH